jgi:hypothetical protein
MPVWPKSFYTFGVNLMTAATEWRLHRRTSAVEPQREALSQLTQRLATTSHWRALGVEAGLPYATFRTRVPLQTFEQLEPAIERMKRGEAAVLWPGRCDLFTVSAGTSTGRPKTLPLTPDLLEHFRRSGFDALLYQTVRARHARAFNGRHLLCGAAAELTPVSRNGDPGALAGELSGIAALRLPAWAEKHYYEPGVSIGRIADWDARIEAIATHRVSHPITVLAGLPNWMVQVAQVLRERLAGGRGPAKPLQAYWPQLECLVHGGIPLAPYADELQTLLGPKVQFHEVYAASEAFIATQDGEGSRGLRLMPDEGVFFEFLPMTEFDPARLAQLGPKAIPLAEVKTGIDYVVIVTTPGGLARYVLGDVVRFLSTKPARLIYVGGTTLRLHAFGEHVTEVEVTDALANLCRKRGWTIVQFHVAPRLEQAQPGSNALGRHEWWVELRPGTMATPTGPNLATDLDAELRRTNASYAAVRQSGALQAPYVRLVMPGVFEQWLRHHRKWGGQHKIARCRNDRLIADGLAKITNFAAD